MIIRIISNANLMHIFMIDIWLKIGKKNMFRQTLQNLRNIELIPQLHTPRNYSKYIYFQIGDL